MLIKKIVYSVFLAFSIVCIANATIYYADDTGIGSGDCPIGAPCTLSRGLTMLSAGDTLYLREGTYQQVVSFSTNGTSENRIIISGYTGETATIDGNNTYPTGGGTCWDNLVTISGDYVTLKDLYITNSTEICASISGDYSNVENVSIDGCGETGIVASGESNIFDGVTQTDNGNRYGGGCATWGAAIGTLGSNTIIRNSISHDNVGEGINCYSSASSCTIEDSISYDNDSVDLYLDSVTTALVQRNLLYNTGVGGARTGLMIGAEYSQPSGLTIINNMIIGDYEYQALGIDSNVTSMNTYTIAYNTFGTVQATDGYNWNVRLTGSGMGTYTNSIFKNNIVFNDNDDGTTYPVYVAASHSGLTLSYNSWYETPSAQAQGTGDVIEDDPCIQDGSVTPGNLTGNHFMQNSGSLSIDNGNAIAGITEDYFETARDASPDIGAHEYEAEPTIIKKIMNYFRRLRG